MKKTLIILALTVAIANGACKKDSSNGGTSAEKGYVTGKVTDTQGRAMSGVQIIVEDTNFFNSGMTGTTGADGTYRIKTSGGSGSFIVHAIARIPYNGKTYTIDLHPENAASFAGVDGAVRNFIWKLSGNYAYNNPGILYYGASVSLFNVDDVSVAPSISNVEYTFTPVGTLIDGSTGAVFKRRSGAPGTDAYSYLFDIPIGRYTLSAKEISTGMVLRLAEWRQGVPSNYSQQLTFDFYADNIYMKQFRVNVNY